MTEYLRMGELVALSAITLAIIGALLLVLQIGGNGEAPALAIGALATALPVAINALRNLSASRAMQEMAQQLGASQPSGQGDGQ